MIAGRGSRFHLAAFALLAAAVLSLGVAALGSFGSVLLIEISSVLSVGAIVLALVALVQVRRG